MTAFDRAADPEWDRLGVRAIGYPVVDHDHSALVGALDSWERRARMGQFEHSSRMAQIIEAGTQLEPVDRDYLVERLATPAGAREFASSTLTVEPEARIQWLEWIESLPSFAKLFQGVDDSEASGILASWFCQDFIADPLMCATALRTVQRLGQTFSSTLFSGAGWAAEVLGEKDPGASARWRALLATSIRGHSAPIDSMAFLPYTPKSGYEPVALLRVALRPSIRLKARWLGEVADPLSSIPDAELEWGADRASLAAHLTRAIENAQPGDPVLGAMLEDAQVAAYDLLGAFHGVKWPR